MNGKVNIRGKGRVLVKVNGGLGFCLCPVFQMIKQCMDIFVKKAKVRITVFFDASNKTCNSCRSMVCSVNGNLIRSFRNLNQLSGL